MNNNEIADMIAKANEKRKKTNKNWTKEHYDTTNKIIDKIRRGEKQ
jgi:hypothetical protein